LGTQNNPIIISNQSQRDNSL